MKPVPQYADRLCFERELAGRGRLQVAGVDEAGCGPLAGPVVAAAVMFPSAWLTAGLPENLLGLNDSKQLTESQREEFFTLLTTDSKIQRGVAVIPVEIIDRINILQATHQGMREALAQLAVVPDHVLVDGRPVKSLRLPNTPLVKGDARSYTIAAASILAKVTRDRLMLDYDRQYPGYGFAAHKGYGTPQHLAALIALGPCPQHRRSFAPLRPPKPETGELFPCD